jgi:hypothetical protein
LSGIHLPVYVSLCLFPRLGPPVNRPGSSEFLQIFPNQADKSYVTQRPDRLYSNAEKLMEQALSMGLAADVTVLELPAGGYYLIPGAGHDLAAMQVEHGARTGWQVSRSASGVLVSGRSGDRSCLLKRDLAEKSLAGMLRDAPAYLLI